MKLRIERAREGQECRFWLDEIEVRGTVQRVESVELPAAQIGVSGLQATVRLFVDAVEFVHETTATDERWGTVDLGTGEWQSS